MNLFVAIAVCFIPLVVCIALCLMFVKEFKVLYALSAIFFGFIAMLLIILFRTGVDELSSIITLSFTTFFGFLASTLLFAFLEEGVKMLLLPFLPKKIQSLKIYILVCLIFGCSVGCFETLMYLVTGFENTVTRLFTSVVIHSVCALLSGYFIWALKNKKRFIRAFGVSVLLHGLYNFFVIQVSFLWWLSIITIFLALLKSRAYYQLFSNSEKSIT